MAIAVEGADYDAENPAVGVASALVFYLAAHPRDVDSNEYPDQVIHRAVREQWRDGPPRYVRDAARPNEPAAVVRSSSS